MRNYFTRILSTSPIGRTLILTVLLFSSLQSHSQINEDEIGAWYMYFWNTELSEGPWGIQGDIQFRNWDLGGDLEQLLLRGGLTYKPDKANVKFTFGYANIQTGQYGESNSTTSESRIYQEALLPHHAGGRFFLTHRFRYEQRFVQDQDFRTRYRYNLFLNVALNKKIIEQHTLYLALYNEIFINGQRKISENRFVEVFDRNRFYSALGFALKNQLKVQAGYMIQTTDNWSKAQIQLSLHHSF